MASPLIGFPKASHIYLTCLIKYDFAQVSLSNYSIRISLLATVIQWGGECQTSVYAIKNDRLKPFWLLHT